MSALVKKEIRLLLPSWIAAVLLAMVQGITRPYDFYVASLLFFGLTIMALTTIGREASLNTFSSLLAQPAERVRIWTIKLSVLAAAFVTVFVVWLMAFGIAWWNSSVAADDAKNSYNLFITICLIATATFTGGLWTTLLLRQIAGAFWLTLLVPAVLSGFSAAFFAQSESDELVIAVLSVVIGVYSIAGFLFARWLFFRAQDVGWTGGIIALPQLKLFAASSNAADSPRKRQPIFALLKKELQLQQVSLLGAAGLLVLHLGVIVLRMHHKFARDSAGEILTSIFWMLWLVLPVIIGAMAVAEERRLGVMESQLCLPVSRRVQFVIKGFPALLLGTLLGGVLPMLLEAFGGMNMAFKSVDHSEASRIVTLQIFIVALSAWLALVSFFASSLARNFLQAVGFAIATFVGTVLLGSALIDGRMFFLDSIPAHSVLPVIIAVPTTIVALLWLAYLNFKNFRDGWPLGRRNLLGWAGAVAFIVVSSAALYNRIWEVFEPAEPAHGSAKFSLANPPVLRTDSYNNLLVRLPDGRVWFDYLTSGRSDSDTHRIKQLLHLLLNPLPKNAVAARFVAGSDWRSATTKRVDFLLNYKEGNSQPSNHIVGYLDTVGIKADGTLWVSDASKGGAWTGDKMNRFGNDTNWQQLVRTRYDVLLLKNDGTLWLWGWGTNRFDWGTWQTNWPNLHNYQPRQIGMNANWQEIFGNWWIDFARKSDGSTWQVGFNDKSGQNSLHRESRESRESNLDQATFQTLALSGNGEMAYVRPDGTLWINWLYQQNGTNEYSGFMRVGMDTNWTAVTLNWKKMVALKSDGSLWQWQFDWQWDDAQKNFIQAAQKSPTRMGTHNDWVAIANIWGDVIALAADGSLWLWPDRRQYEDATLLKLPKQPQPLGNIFSTPN